MEEKKSKKKKVSHIHINQKWCMGGYICLEVYPQKVFEKSKEVSEKGFTPVFIAHPEQCTACPQREMLCLDLAITVKKEN